MFFLTYCYLYLDQFYMVSSASSALDIFLATPSMKAGSCMTIFENIQNRTNQLAIKKTNGHWLACKNGKVWDLAFPAGWVTATPAAGASPLLSKRLRFSYYLCHWLNHLWIVLDCHMVFECHVHGSICIERWTKNFTRGVLQTVDTQIS